MGYTKGSPLADCRRQFLGWALYARVADTACYLRSPKKCPPPANLLNRPVLPTNLIWPLTRDWLSCQSMISAVVTGNLHHLDQIVLSYPSFRFGFEEYVFQLRDIIHSSKREVLSTVANVAPKAIIASSVELARIRIPVEVPDPGLFAVIELLYWDSAQTSLRLRILHPLPKSKKDPTAPTDQVFSTILIDTDTGRWGLEEHRPGWYQAYGLRPDLWKRYLGLRPARRSLPTSVPADTIAPAQGVVACSTSGSSTAPPKLSAMPSEPSNVPS